MIVKTLAPNLFTKNVESFALELLHLIRGARIYPNKHPTLLEVAKNVLGSAPFDLQGSLTIGVTSWELVVGGKFISGKARNLASMFNMLIELTPNRLSVRSLHKQLTVWGIAGSPKIAYSPDSNTRSNMPENAYDLDGHDTFREERSSH